MDKLLYQKQFQAFLKMLSVIFLILLIVLGVSMLALLGVIILISVSSGESVQHLLDIGTLSAQLKLSGLNIALSDEVMASFQYDKQILLIQFLIWMFYNAIVFVITFFVWKIVKSIHNGAIFTKENGNRIEWISYGVILMSLTINTITATIAFTFSQLFQLGEFMSSTEWIESVSYHFFDIHWSLLLSGLILWIISKIFKYGAFLQAEYDATV